MAPSVRPRDIHCIWLLLRAVGSIGGSGLPSRTRDWLDLSDDEIARLTSTAYSLGLTSSPNSPICLTDNGLSLASLTHWKLWTVPDILTRRFTRLGIDALFLGADSWTKRPAIVDLFGGAGGFSLAFEAAGFAVKAAIDNDLHACRAFEKNFPFCNVIRKDIHRVAEQSQVSLESEWGFNLDEVTGIIGSPPCQGFSNMGERLADDPRNQLARTFLDVVLNVEPKFFVFENVPALKSFGVRPTFDAFLMRLNRATGPRVAAIVNELPRPNESKPNRSLQAKKRLMSESIRKARQTIDQLVADEGTVNDLWEVASVGIEALTEAVVSGLPDVYSETRLRTARKSLKELQKDLVVIATSLAVESFIKSGTVNKKDCKVYLARLCHRQRKECLLGRVAKEIIQEYESIPNLEEYRKVSLVYVLGNSLTDWYKRPTPIWRRRCETTARTSHSKGTTFRSGDSSSTNTNWSRPESTPDSASLDFYVSRVGIGEV